MFNPINWVAVVTQCDRPKSVRNPCVIEFFSVVVMLSLCSHDISVDIGVLS